MDIKDIIQSLSVLSAKYHAAQNELSNKYRFDQLRDVRINVFKHCFIVIDSTYIIMLVRLHHLYDNTWWSSLMERNLVSKQLTEEQQSIFIHGFDTFVDSAYITMLFVSVESAFRSFYSSIFSKKTPFSFHDVYEDLLRKFSLDNYIDLLSLASYVRNSLHNNGVHTLNDAEVVWRNMTYHFKKGKKIEGWDVWHTFIIITTDMICLRNL